MYPILRDLRENCNLNQATMAKMLHVAQTTYSRYELGAIDIPTASLIALAHFYHTSTDYLLGLTDEVNPYPPSKRRS